MVALAAACSGAEPVEEEATPAAAGVEAIADVVEEIRALAAELEEIEKAVRSSGWPVVRMVKVEVMRREMIRRVEEAFASGDWEQMRLLRWAPRGTPPLELVQGVRESFVDQRDRAVESLEVAREAQHEIEANRRARQEATRIGR